ncbi:MAG: hypothetical protein JSV79_09210 [Armatimonadota bacterium]|nr:MAG: hypothetical protein JSV79_09210 [Armatimonadota bacterium]
MQKGEGGITRRSVLLGLLLAGGLCALTPYNDYVVGNTYIAGNHFPVGAVAVLLLLALLNLAAFRLRGRALLSIRETAVIYIIIMVTSGIPSSGLLRYMIPCGTVPYYYASPGNQWEQLFWNRIPTWMAVPDVQASAWFWEGLPEGARLPWRLWWVMMSRWSIFFGALWVMMICLSALVRKQWADRERLTFPLVQFPVEVLRQHERGPSAGFFTNRLVWIGAGAVFLIHLINGLHQHFPALPNIPTFWDFDQYLPDRPWNAATPIYLGLYFSAVGFGYLLSLEVAAGFWVSVLFIKAEGVVLSALGHEGTSAWSGVISDITRSQQMGGLLAIAFVIFWLLRGTIADAFRRAFTRAHDPADDREPISYRWTVFGFLVGFGIALWWLLAAGMTPHFALAHLIIFVAICLVLTRIIAEAGMLMTHLIFNPVDYLLLFGGTTAVGPTNLTVLTFVDCALTWDLREFLMPSVLNAFRFGEIEGVSTRRLVSTIALALLVCVIISVPAYLLTFYKLGAFQANNVVELEHHPTRFFRLLATRLQNPDRPATVQYISMLTGGLIVAALSWLRLNFVWWPIHPLGFVMATSWASLCLWFSLFLGWLFKLITIRYTGLRGYVQFRPLFMGVILGDVLGALLWIIVGWFTGVGFMVTVN